MLSQPTVLITGGSSGIGFELAKLFAANQYQLVIVSKPANELAQAKTYLEQNYEVNLITMQKDLTLKSSVLEVYDEVKQRGITVNVLVNNAGVGRYGYFHEIDLDKEYEMIQLNVAAVMMLSKLFLRDMIARNEGQILNIASVAGLQPNPLFACYGASKSFVISLSRAMSYEAHEKATNVTVTVVCPPATRMTGFAKTAGMEGKRVFSALEAMEPAQVARAAYQALQQGQEFVILPAWYSILLRMVNRLLPTRIVMALVRRSLGS